MERVPICLVGCGGMGHRHILAYRTLEDTGISNVDLMAVCDIREENSQFAAREIERLFGRRPLVYTDLTSGKHALVEKPLSITIRACRALIDATADGGAILATAENYRRDPPNHLVKAILDAGLVGDPFMMMQVSAGGTDEMAITPWRHLKEKGAIGMDMGVHYADIIQFYLGEYDQIFGSGFIVEPLRRKPDHESHPLESYRKRVKTYPEFVEATGEDSVVALYRMASGAVANLTLVEGRGGKGWERSVHGPAGAVYASGERNGNPVLLRLEGKEYRGKEVLELLPDFELDEITARLFGPDGVEYGLPTEEPHPGYAIDARHLAIEYHDFARAILESGRPEVDGLIGTRAVAAILGA